MTDQANYSERYCAFVDILGFSELIKELRAGATNFEALKALLQKVHSPGTSEIRTQSISDAVALSTDINPRALLSLFDALDSLAVDLLCEGYFIRGAIVKGPLYHDEHMVFGEALVEAYKFETEVARFPRIIVTKAVMDDIRKYVGQTNKKDCPSTDRVRHSDDGPVYLDVLQPIVMLGREQKSGWKKLTDEENRDCARFAKIRSRIQERFGDSVDHPSHFEKVQWFARYWNDTVAVKTGYGRINGPGLDQKAFA